MTRNNLYTFGKFLAAFAVAGCFWTGCEKTPQASYKAIPYAYIGEDNGNMPTSGLISVDYTDAPEGSEIDKLVDGNLSTRFVTSHNAFDIIWNGDASSVAVSYYIASAADSPECDPKSWTFSGSTDNKTWKTLDSQSGIEFTRGEEKVFEVDNDAAYKYYRLKIRSNAGAETTQIAEWGISVASVSPEFIDIKDRLSDLAQYFTGWSTSSSTPMGNRFENAHEATSDEIAWLQDASENPPIEAASISGDYSWRTCSVTLYPYGNPVPADVNQHAIGDCCLCAVLASFAYLHPDFIKNIITVSGSNFKVAMYDPKGNPMTVVVNNEFICDGGGTLQALSGKNNKATWSTVLEKALMKWEYVYRINYPIGGIGTEHAAPPFTGQGNSFAITPGSVTPAQLSRIAKTAVELGYVGIGGFTQSDVVVEAPFKSVSGHAFTIMLPQKSDALFAMRNPWGGASGSPDGKEDGVMNIYDDSIVPPIVDFRIVYSGKASEYPLIGVGPYTPPSFSGKGFWISPAMRANCGLAQTGTN